MSGDPRPPPSRPDSADAPMSLFARHPAAQSVGGLPGAVGARILGGYRQSVGLVQTLLGALAAPLTPGAAAGAVASQIALRQIFYTGFEALSLVSVIAGFLGATMILQMQLMAGALPGDVVGQILVTVVLRELAPLVTAIVVSGRSGTAIATELGNMRANAEVLGLSSLGIDPMRFVVWPRIVGCVVSVMVLTVYFGMVAIMGGYALGVFLGAASVADLQSGFSTALGVGDLVLYLVKSTGLGLIVGWLCCHFGLAVQGSPTEVPQRASQAVIMSLLASVVYNTAVTAVFYWIVGPPMV